MATLRSSSFSSDGASQISSVSHSSSSRWSSTSFSNSLHSLRKNRRRLTQEMLQNLGKTEASDDSHFQRHHLRFCDIIASLKSVIEHMNQYRTQTSEYGRVCSQLGNQVLQLIHARDIGENGDAETFSSAMAMLDSAQKPLINDHHTGDQLIQAAIYSIEKKIIQMESHKKLLEKRAKKKLDHDAYERKLATLERSKKAPSASRMMKKQMRLLQARDELEQVTYDLYKVFAHYEAQRDSLISPELELFRQTMEDRFSRNLSASQFKLKHLTVEKDLIEKKATKILGQMSGRETLSKASVESLNQEACTISSPIQVLKKPVPKCPNPAPFKKTVSLQRSNNRRRHSEITRRLSGSLNRLDNASSLKRSSLSDVEQLCKTFSTQSHDDPVPDIIEETENPTERIESNQMLEEEDDDFVPPPPPEEEWNENFIPPPPADLEDIAEGDEEEE